MSSYMGMILVVQSQNNDGLVIIGCTESWFWDYKHVSLLGVSENGYSSTPLYPMVLLIIIPMNNGYFIGNIPYFQTNPHDFDMFHYWLFNPEIIPKAAVVVSWMVSESSLMWEKQ